jgi:acyl phosphate:glycerol-3-phosphate acyltransferase
MEIIIGVGIILVSYILGSIPFGLIIVKLKTGQDIRLVESGRTGGTNALRAAGFWAGLLTAILDILKGAVSVWIARLAQPNAYLLHILAPTAAILGHNYSIFLPERDKLGHFVRLRGGAGGAPSLGGAFGLWAPSLLIIFPIGALFFFTVALIIFAVRAWMGLNSWSYVLYGLIAEVLLVWALRPNIKKLIAGNERIVKISLHGLIKAKRESQQVNHGNIK